MYIEERIDRDKHFFVTADFCCGADDPLNLFLSMDAFDYDENKLGSTYLLFDENGESLLAFYTIKANGIQMYDSAKDEYNSIPVIEISRIAVEYDFQGSGLGKAMFYDYILPKVEIVEQLVAIKAIIVFVEPDNSKGIRFYESLGFKKADETVQQKIDETFNEECDLYILQRI